MMMKFAVTRKVDPRGYVGEFTARQIDENKFDLRIYDIVPSHEYKKRNSGRPFAILKVKAKNGKEFEDIYFPVFDFMDLDKLYISTSCHFILKESLSKKQQLWIEANSQANKIF